MRLDVLGCRGSTVAEGPDHVRYGGATSSVGIDLTEEESILLDAGTGVRHLSRVRDRPFRGSLLLSHLHWDHVHGLPFASLMDDDRSEVDVFVPTGTTDARTVIDRMMSPPLFPISSDGLRGRWRFHDLEPGRHAIGGYDVAAFEVPHKGGRTFGYRVTSRDASVGYVPDHATGLALEPAREIIRSLEHVDVLIHDTQNLDSEAADRGHLGHSTFGYAVALTRAAGAGSLLAFHHDPARTDDQLDQIAATLPSGVCIARQNTTVRLGAEG